VSDYSECFYWAYLPSLFRVSFCILCFSSFSSFSVCVCVCLWIVCLLCFYGLMPEINWLIDWLIVVVSNHVFFSSSSSRIMLNTLKQVTNNGVDELGDCDNHITIRRRHDRSIALVRVTVAHGGWDTAVRLRQTLWWSEVLGTISAQTSHDR